MFSLVHSVTFGTRISDITLMTIISGTVLFAIDNLVHIRMYSLSSHLRGRNVRPSSPPSSRRSVTSRSYLQLHRKLNTPSCYLMNIFKYSKCVVFYGLSSAYCLIFPEFHRVKTFNVFAFMSQVSEVSEQSSLWASLTSLQVYSLSFWYEVPPQQLTQNLWTYMHTPDLSWILEIRWSLSLIPSTLIN